MLRIDALTYRIGGRVLLDGTEAVIAPGHRVGLVGRNGCGKTTLLRLIAGELEPDAGRIWVPPTWRIGITRQEAPDTAASLIETVLAADTELARLSCELEAGAAPERLAEIHERMRARHAHAAPARAARILKGLGFDDAAQRRPCREISGGMRMRVALAALLFTEPDLLLLDEPTNHLDLEAGLWLEDFLRGYAGTVVVVSHDRDLLNRVVGGILHLDVGKLTAYTGGYDRFEETRRLRLALDQKQRRRQEAERARIRAFVDRFRSKASKARQAQSRLKMLSRLQPILPHAGEEAVALGFPTPDPLAPPLLSLRDVAVGYGSTPVLRNIGVRLDDDDRIALLGANGNGKSTLMKLLAGRLTPSSGEVTRSPKLRIGYFAQHQADELDVAATPLIELARRRPRDPEERLRAHLGHFGFGEARAGSRIGDLSGGEKARLLLALMSSERPHILLLDEPTNHLDVTARQALVEAINAFKGAVVIASHDANVIELTADRLWLVENGRVTPFEGDLDDYRRRVLAADGRGSGTAPAVASAATGGSPKKDERRRAAEKRAALAPLRRRLTETEAAIDRLAGEKAALTTALADLELYAGDSARLLELQRRFARVERELAAAEEHWLALHDACERAETAMA